MNNPRKTNRKGGVAMRYRRILPLALAATLLLSGCDAVEEAVESVMARVSSSGSSESQVITGETVSGIITQVNGNEITLDLVTLDGAMGGQGGPGSGGPSGEEEASGQVPAGEGEAPSGEGGEPSAGGDGAPAGMDEAPAGGAPAGGEGGAPAMEEDSGGITVGLETTQKNYTRTGETATYQIPIGATVITLTGTERDFNSLTTDLLVTITLREDGTTPAQVQVIQSLS